MMHFFMFVDLKLSVKWLKPMGGSLFKKLHPFHISLRGVAHPIKVAGASESSKSSHILSSTSNRFLNLHKVVLVMQCNCLCTTPCAKCAAVCATPSRLAQHEKLYGQYLVFMQLLQKRCKIVRRQALFYHS